MNSVVTEILITMSASFYGSINSEILLYPDFFNLLHTVCMIYLTTMQIA